MKSKMLLLTAILIAVISLKLFIFYGQKKSITLPNPQIQQQHAPPPQFKVDSKTLPPKLTQALEKCLEQGHYQTDYPSSAPEELADYLQVYLANLSGPHNLWENRHLQRPEGQVVIMRLFVEDGKNGNFNKLMLYQEDENHLPQIMPIPQDEQINPSPAIIAKWAKIGTNIYHEIATSYQNPTGVDVFVQEVNGEVKEMAIHTPLHFVECLQPMPGSE